MEIKDVFVSLVVVFVATVAIFTWMTDWNEKYDDTAGSTFNNSMARTTLFSNISKIGVSVGNNTQQQEGGAPTSNEEGLIQQGRSTISLAADMVGLVPALMSDSAAIIGIPESYQDAARIAFWFVFGITIAYIVLLGVKSLFGR